jgi:hypothetical protein
LVDITGNNNNQYAVKIIDFGISTVFDPDQKLTLSIGTVIIIIHLKTV